MIDEEIKDQRDNDGDGFVDEDLSEVKRFELCLLTCKHQLNVGKLYVYKQSVYLETQ